MEHPQCTCGRLAMPGLKMLTQQRDDSAASEGPVDPQSSVILRTGPVFLALVPAATEGQKILQRLFPFSDY